MRSTVTLNPIRDTTRPPPPVPPRPSKQIIAEALAKSRKQTTTPIEIIPNRYKPVPKPRQQIPTSKSTEDLTAIPSTPPQHERTIVYRSPSLTRAGGDSESIYGRIKPIDNKFKSMSDITKDEGSDSDYFSSLGDGGHSNNNNNTVVIVEGGVSDKVIVQSKIQQSDWFQVGDNGKQVRYSSCQITINECTPPTPPTNNNLNDYPVLPDALISRIQQQCKMNSLQGLPPLPKSLSGFNLSGGLLGDDSLSPPQPPQQQGLRNTNPFLVKSSPPGNGESSPSDFSPPMVPPRTIQSGQNNLGNGGGVLDNSRCNSAAPGGRKLTTLDTQLATLRREMVSHNLIFYF